MQQNMGNMTSETALGLPTFPAKLVCVSLDNTLIVGTNRAYLYCEIPEHRPTLSLFYPEMVCRDVAYKVGRLSCNTLDLAS
jgi:hypothetical protein